MKVKQEELNSVKFFPFPKVQKSRIPLCTSLKFLSKKIQAGFNTLIIKKEKKFVRNCAQINNSLLGIFAA